MDQIGITLDIDWAPDEVVQYVLDLLDKHQVKATFFSTHDSALLKSLDKTRYEIGIHPNFNQGGDYDTIIKELKAIYPKAIGVRAHGLFESSQILRLFLDNGLKYDVNTFIPLRQGLYPVLRLKELVRIPYYWEDDAHFSTQTTFELSELQVHKKGLKIYNFHPIHIFMNTSSIQHYDTFKPFYHEPDVLKKNRNTGRGTQTLFVDLLQYLAENRVPTYLCREIYREYLAENRVP